MAEGPSATEWAEAMAAFDAWSALEESARVPWLDALAVSAPGLHAHVMRLIAADREAAAASFLTPGDTPAPAVGAGLEGRHFGPWLIERLIGSGGMGHVWLARRTDGLYDARAAIKLMRLAAIDAGANARFAREGQLLGRLSHPNIAHLLDAGVTPEGERYLVLEYVDGERIDRYCERGRLTVSQRLALFIVVCEAVAHAHENFVVHRDLKPSNIFVTPEGVVKLLDFGVAKLIDADADEQENTGSASDLTRSNGAALTPEYASPEQLSGGPVTAATDVYGLGLVLYALLNGSRPFEIGSTPGRTAQPGHEPRPLWHLPADAETAQRIAAERRSSVPALRKALHDDVAVVVAKAIKAEPAERYRSVPDFADDLRRTLAHRPIAARPDSLAYRGAKFARRHWFGLGAAMLIVLAVGAGVSGTLLKQHEAEREAARAVAVKRFLLDLFEQARTTVRSDGLHAREATIGDVLAAGSQRVGASFASQPEIRDEVFEVLASLYGDAFDPKQAVALARQRLKAARTAFGARDPRCAPALIGLASALLTAGEESEPQALLADAQALLDRAGDRSSLVRARLLRWQGIVTMLTRAKPPWEAHPLHRAVDLLHRRYADDDEVLETLVTLPSEACRYGRIDEAIAAADELARRTRARYGDDNLYLDSATLLHGQLLLAGDHAVDALPFLQQAVEGFRRHVGDTNQNTLLARLDLSEALWASGQQDASQQLFSAVEHAAAQDHAGDAQVERMLTTTRKALAKRRAGQAVHPCSG